MLDKEQITIGKLKQAYNLNAQEAESLLNALFPDFVFPFEAWRQAYDKSGMVGALEAGPAKPLGLAYIPDNICPTRVYAIQLVASLIDPARLNKISALEQGFELVIQSTYGDAPFPFQEERETLFRFIRQEDKEFRQQKGSQDAWRMQHQFIVEYSFIHDMFPDTIVVDKSAAIHHLFSCGYSLRHEVKGISHALVERVIADIPVQVQPAASPQVEGNTSSAPTIPGVFVSRSLWEGKSPTAVRDGMRNQDFIDPVIAHVLYEWCNLKNKTQIGRLLGPPDQDDSSCLRRANRLLAEASAMNIQNA